MIRTLPLDHNAGVGLLHSHTKTLPLEHSQPDQLSSVVCVFCHALVDFFQQILTFFLLFHVLRFNNIGGAAIKVSFYPRVGITECMEMDIVTNSYFEGNIILLFWLTLMIGFFLALQRACHCSCCHGNKIYLRLNVVNRIPTHARMCLCDAARAPLCPPFALRHKYKPFGCS